MFDKIIYISDHSANIKLREEAEVSINLMNLHLIFEDRDKKVLGEVDDLDGDVVKARFLGEIVNNKLIGGVIRKPSLDAKIRVISTEEIPLIVGGNVRGNMLLGMSPFYNDYPVYLNVNGFFSNHFAIFGNSGSGKSCGVTRIIQNMFEDKRLFPYKSNILLFDSSGEFYNAFKDISHIDPNYNYRFYTTNETDDHGDKLRLPIWLLNVADLALLLEATAHSQLPIIERMLRLAMIFSEDDVDSNAYKNHLIAKAVMTILYTNQTAPNKRNDVFSILASCSTPEFNLEAIVQGIGYTRKFRDCFLIDSQGGFTESVLLTEYIATFIKDEYESYEPKGEVFYTLETLEKALNFTLISEGWLRNENTYGDAVTIRVRLHSLITGSYSKYFDVSEYVSVEQYLSSLLISQGKKYQIVNINLDDVDDVFAKVITKIYSRLIFEFAKGLEARASIPFHILVEEAHRYIQNDKDRFLIGYNIFERIAKEGRKYGVMLGLITQRPAELSDTVISQCSNFLIFKMNHPTDVDYIRKMVPNISDEIVEKQKSLQAGTCLGFGMAFKIPLIVKLKMPSPEPRSGNCDVVNIWDGNTGSRVEQAEVQEPVSDTWSVEQPQSSMTPEQSNFVSSVQQSQDYSVPNQNQFSDLMGPAQTPSYSAPEPSQFPDLMGSAQTPNYSASEESQFPDLMGPVQTPSYSAAEPSQNSNLMGSVEPSQNYSVPNQNQFPDLMSPVAQSQDYSVQNQNQFPDLMGSVQTPSYMAQEPSQFPDLMNQPIVSQPVDAPVVPQYVQPVEEYQAVQPGSMVPDINIGAPMTPPQNSVTIPTSLDMISNQPSVTPIMPADTTMPNIIIPTSENMELTNKLIEGFDPGVTVTPVG